MTKKLHNNFCSTIRYNTVQLLCTEKSTIQGESLKNTKEQNFQKLERTAAFSKKKENPFKNITYAPNLTVHELYKQTQVQSIYGSSCMVHHVWFKYSSSTVQVQFK